MVSLTGVKVYQAVDTSGEKPVISGWRTGKVG